MERKCVKMLFYIKVLNSFAEEFQLAKLARLKNFYFQLIDKYEKT